MKTMKINMGFALLLTISCAISTVSAQNETMYIFKDGLIVGEFNIADMDSVMFYLPGSGTVTDIDGNVYPTVTIGQQQWMAKNLRVTHYPDGSSIPYVTGNTAWANLEDNGTDDAYCWYEDDINNAEDYGALYTWAAALGDNAVSSSGNPSGVQGACPDGWHVPSIAEWEELENYITNEGFFGEEGKVLRSTDWEGYDYYGFTALPAGMRNYITGQFTDPGTMTSFVSTTDQGSGSIYIDAALIQSNNNQFDLVTQFKSGGHSVRCVKD